MYTRCLERCLAQGWHLAAIAFLNVSPREKAHCHGCLFSFIGSLGVKSKLFSSSQCGPSKLQGTYSSTCLERRRDPFLNHTHAWFTSWRATPFSFELCLSSQAEQNSLTRDCRRRLGSPREDEDSTGSKVGSMITLNSQDWILWTSIITLKLKASLKKKKKKSCFVIQTGLELKILLPQPSECWDYRYVIL